MRKGTVCFPSATWIGTCSQPAMQLSLRNALLAPTQYACGKPICLETKRARNSWGKSQMRKKNTPIRSRNFFEGFGQLTGNTYLSNFERLDNNEGGWRVSRARNPKIRMVRSLSLGMFHQPHRSWLKVNYLLVESVMARRGLRNRHKLAEMGLKTEQGSTGQDPQKADHQSIIFFVSGGAKSVECQPMPVSRQPSFRESIVVGVSIERSGVCGILGRMFSAFLGSPGAPNII